MGMFPWGPPPPSRPDGRVEKPQIKHIIIAIIITIIIIITMTRILVLQPTIIIIVTIGQQL